MSDHLSPADEEPPRTAIERLEDRLVRRLDEMARRQGERLGELEDDSHAVRQELAQVRLELVAIHGTNGHDGKIGNLSQAVADIRDSINSSGAEQRANRRAMVGTGVALLVAIITGVVVMRERLTTVETDSAHHGTELRLLDERMRDRNDRLERRLDQVLDRIDGIGK